MHQWIVAWHKPIPVNGPNGIISQGYVVERQTFEGLTEANRCYKALPSNVPFKICTKIGSHYDEIS